MSEEFQQSGSYIYRLYGSGLGRSLTYDEFRNDHPHVVGGSDLEAQKAAFADAFVERAEFVDRYQQDTNGVLFIDRLLSGIQVDSGLDLSSQQTAFLAAYGSGADLKHSRSAVATGNCEQRRLQHGYFESRLCNDGVLWLLKTRRRPVRLRVLAGGFEQS